MPRIASEHSCSTCLFWTAFRGGLDYGECHASPPVPVPARKNGSPALFPLTESKDWCGRHPRIAAQVDFMSRMPPVSPPQSAHRDP